MNKLKSKVKKTMISFLRIIGKYAVIGKTSWSGSQAKTATTRVAILTDYLDASFLFDSIELRDCEVGFICTQRYPFFSFLFNKRWQRVKFLHFTPDYKESRNAELLAYCQENSIDYVLIQAGDFLVPAVNYLNAQLNGKGNDSVAVQCSLDKNYMRDVLNQNGVSVVNKVAINNREDLTKVDFFPCVLKPNIGTLSEGIVLVNSATELNQAFDASNSERRQTEFETTYLAEEYIVGRQFDVEGIMDNGKVIILCTVEENYEGFFPYFNINWFFFNAFMSAAISQEIERVLQQAFSACGMIHGAWHCELRITEQGEIKILEFSNRMGGGFETSITNVTGNHFADLYVQAMLGREIKLAPNKNRYMLEKYFKNEQDIKQWETYLKSKQLKYQLKPWLYRGHIAMLRLYHDDAAVMTALGEYFGLVYINEQ